MTAADPQGQVERWLSAFEQALTKGDIATAVSMFDADCYWRDLVSFTWNITTAEGHPAVKDLLDTTLSRIKPSHWQLARVLGCV